MRTESVLHLPVLVVGTGNSDAGTEDTTALVILDRFTGWIERHPAPQKTKAETKLVLQKYTDTINIVLYRERDGYNESYCKGWV